MTNATNPRPSPVISKPTATTTYTQTTGMPTVQILHLHCLVMRTQDVF